MKQLYYSFIYPYLTYAITSWGSACKTRLNRIRTKQNKCIRSIIFAHSRENATSYYNLLDILKFDSIFKLKVALFAHIINDPTGIPTIFSGTLPLAFDCQSHYTRFVSNLNFHRPQIDNNYGASTFSFIASKIWETIPLEFKKLCYYRFPKHFKLYLLNSQSFFAGTYTDLTYFSLTTFSQVLLLCFSLFCSLFYFYFLFNTRQYCYFSTFSLFV